MSKLISWAWGMNKITSKLTAAKQSKHCATEPPIELSDLQSNLVREQFTPSKGNLQGMNDFFHVHLLATTAMQTASPKS